jgi:hypothetical protein
MNKKSNKNVWGYFYRSAGGRFTEEPAPEMVAMRDETIPLKGIHLFDIAHVVMLVEEGIIQRDVGTRILDALSDIDDDYVKVRQKIGGGGHSGEAYLIENLGRDIGGQLHVGRSSADLIAVAVRIEQRDCLLEIMSGLIFIRHSKSHLLIILFPGFLNMNVILIDRLRRLSVQTLVRLGRRLYPVHRSQSIVSEWQSYSVLTPSYRIPEMLFSDLITILNYFPHWLS